MNIPFAVDTGTTNSLIASLIPALTSLVAGTTVEVRVVNDITGAVTNQSECVGSSADCTRQRATAASW